MVRFLVRAFEYAVPDPYIFAAALTVVTALLAFAFAPHRSPADVATGWYNGIFDILAFALQMILILVTGYALAASAPVSRALGWIASRASTPKNAVSLTFVVSAAACWLNWGFGLVAAGLLAREIARRMRIDFGWLVAAAYSGFLVWASGLSSSIALAQATPGNKLNIVQAISGQVLPLRTTIGAPFNYVPCLVLVVVLAATFRALQPAETQTGDVAALDDANTGVPAVKGAARGTLAFALENAWVFNAVIGLSGLAYLGWRWTTSGFALDINSVIFVFLCAGLLLHWRPIAYANAVNGAARICGPLILQYPIYGGIMGIMTATGLAGVIAAWFAAFSTAHTLPFWSYVSSIAISLFVPSGGGHWAVQGPFAVPAAIRLHASLPATAMGVAIGEEVANMIQPFWALPILAIAGVGLRRVMAFTAISFAIAFVVFGVSLLVLA
ncbi:MAG TPA: TIGR00366 family protein [Candidatus Baltobacteraceae bacterium]|jgi:short-chain fatty acids transporter|nr:TIGR00366 family protein [Candidatus Baltobacteraceae bacterium]